MSTSLGLLATFCRALQICTRAHAATASQIVHRIGDVKRVSGKTVENTDSSRGDWHSISMTFIHEVRLRAHV